MAITESCLLWGFSPLSVMCGGQSLQVTEAGSVISEDLRAAKRLPLPISSLSECFWHQSSAFLQDHASDLIPPCHSILNPTQDQLCVFKDE